MSEEQTHNLNKNFLSSLTQFCNETGVDLIVAVGMCSVYHKHNKSLESVISLFIDAGFTDCEIREEVNKKGGLSDAFYWFDQHPEEFAII